MGRCRHTLQQHPVFPFPAANYALTLHTTLATSCPQEAVACHGYPKSARLHCSKSENLLKRRKWANESNGMRSLGDSSHCVSSRSGSVSEQGRLYPSFSEAVRFTSPTSRAGDSEGQRVLPAEYLCPAALVGDQADVSVH